MAELMTLQEAVLRMEPSDFLKEGDHGPLIRKDDNGEFRYNVDGEHFRIHVDHFVKSRWQIIPAEPKVLSAEEIFIKVTNNSDPGGWTSDDIKYAIKKSAKNQCLNHKELREAVSIWISGLACLDLEHAPNAKRVKEAFKNLKPLNTE